MRRHGSGSFPTRPARPALFRGVAVECASLMLGEAQLQIVRVASVVAAVVAAQEVSVEGHRLSANAGA
jgi:hypothetical protein